MSDRTTGSLPLIEWAFAVHSRDRYTESGDQCLVQPFSGGVLVAVVDGLGHGEKAAAAAKAAVAALAEQAYEPVASLLEHCHRQLLRTRGVVMSLASFRVEAGTMTWLGVGNVSGILLREQEAEPSKRERLLLQGGIVGYRLPTLRPVTVDVRPGDALVLATDGIRSGFVEDLDNYGSPEEMANRIMAEYGRETDDALVLVARYRGLIQFGGLR